mgnify:CR=1 FL=1|tara:strand:+ start:1854 stop:3317 length:1464 start_codon:yes stop_codon:yes gene_type:complete
MANINSVTGSNYTSEPTVARGSAAATGALRRKYNFGDMVSELALAQDPFFRFLSKVSKKPTDDPSFKFTEKRSSYTKRYAYMATFDATGLAIPATDPDDSNHTAVVNSSQYTFKFYTDYDSNGNKQNIYGQTMSYYAGVSGTQPQFFIPGQIIKTPVFSSSGSLGNPTDYELWKINSVDLDSIANYAVVNATCVKAVSNVKFMDPVLKTGSALTTSSQEDLEPYKCYVVGSAFAAGSGYPETWQDQPYVTATGQTQIFKTSAVMNNTDRATVLKYEGNEWARIWKEKLIEHKWDIENAMLFGNQNASANTTEGAVNFISTYGNAFSLDTATKTQDDFLDDMSALLDPRYNNATSTVFFCSTAVYNWLHKMSGYFSNNLEQSPNFRSEFAAAGKKKVFGIDVSTISTVYGDMNVVRNVHLDSTNVKILAINMKYCAYRPLVGNGINRDTSVYVGVQTLENSGVDRRVDQILTEAGMEWCCPETHAMWA